MKHLIETPKRIYCSLKAKALPIYNATARPLNLILTFLLISLSAEARVAQLAPHLSKAEAAKIQSELDRVCKKHRMDCRLFTAIIAQESMFRVGAFNRATGDYGLGQINERTLQSMGLCRDRLRSDVGYSLDAAAEVYTYFRKRYKSKEPQTWFCRYNVGTGRLSGQRAQKCADYINAVMRFY